MNKTPIIKFHLDTLYPLDQTHDIYRIQAINIKKSFNLGYLFIRAIKIIILTYTNTNPIGNIINATPETFPYMSLKVISPTRPKSSLVATAKLNNCIFSIGLFKTKNPHNNITTNIIIPLLVKEMDDFIIVLFLLCRDK